MAKSGAAVQAEMMLPPPRAVVAMSEQEAEQEWHRLLFRQMEEAALEVGRKDVCYALDLSDKLLSKQLTAAEGHQPSARLLAYLVKEQKSGRLARWLLTDYADFLPPQRPALVEPVVTLEQIVARADAGEWGKAAREEIRELFERTVRSGR